MWEGCYTDYILDQQQTQKKYLFITFMWRWCSTLCLTAGNRSDDQMIANICQNHHEILKITEMSGWCYHIVKHPRGISDLGDDGILQRKAELMFSSNDFLYFNNILHELCGVEAL